jgi:3-deoxy-D-arabino-heptulosonate 7-phosphate (DAHP) synthase
VLTEEERQEIRRVKDEVYQLLREDDDRRLRGEGNVHDQGVVFEMARRLRDGSEAGAA